MKYLNWLRGLVCLDSPNIYKQLSETLHETDFRWTIRNDDNRACDGIVLRKIYEEESGTECTRSGECSVLEMLIGISYRMDEIVNENPEEPCPCKWFWDILTNLSLNDMDDENYDHRKVMRILDKWLDRKYDRNGQSGIFPLINPSNDQTRIEMWYQMNEYLMTWGFI